MSAPEYEKALTVPCPACKMAADQPCVDPETAASVEGVHSTRIYRAYVVAEAIAHNRAVELEAALDELLNAFRRSLARGMRWQRGEVARVLHRINESFPKEAA